MKKILTTAILALGAFTAANAQAVDYDLTPTIDYPASNQAFLCDDDIWIQATFTNNGPGNIDLTGDTTLMWGFLNSTDSQYTVGGQSIQTFNAYDSVVINMGESRQFTSRTKKVRDLFLVYEEAGNNGFIFRDNVTNGKFMLYVDHTGVGRVNPSSNMFEEAANYYDTDSTNNRRGIVVELCTDLNSIREINANTSAVKVYPNPTTNGTINFDYSFTTTEPATVRVMDVTGRTVLTETIKANPGVQNISLNVANLNAGMYNLEITTSKNRGVSKFTVAK